MEIKTKITGIQHVGIPTSNMEQSMQFYQSLGFEPVHQTVNPNNGDAVVFLQLGNLVMEVYESNEVAGKTGAIDHIALDVTDIESLFDQIKAAYHQLLDEQVQSLPFWEHGVKFFTILGPNAEKVEFCEKLTR